MFIVYLNTIDKNFEEYVILLTRILSSIIELFNCNNCNFACFIVPNFQPTPKCGMKKTKRKKKLKLKVKWNVYFLDTGPKDHVVLSKVAINQTRYNEN